jgi:putative colanic acid biosynthesis acetyltransferase WcaF
MTNPLGELNSIPPSQTLSHYKRPTYAPGVSRWKSILWYFIGFTLVKSYYLPYSLIKVWILRLFGAQIGIGVCLKPGVHIKFPWQLKIGDHCWIGENTWIDNLAPVVLENNVCLSQGVYLCTGNHDWSDPAFQLRLGSIHLGEGCWIAAKSVVGPGVSVGAGAVLTLGSVTAQSLEPRVIYAGNPAQPIKSRKTRSFIDG